jgi:small subunit ribosomal protein S17
MAAKTVAAKPAKKPAKPKAPKAAGGAPKKRILAAEVPRGRTQEVEGEVVSDKMDKTISVLIYRKVPHTRYGKYVKKTSVFKAHDEKNVAKMGDKVKIKMCRPLSKTKRWQLVEVVLAARTDLQEAVV